MHPSSFFANAVVNFCFSLLAAAGAPPGRVAAGQGGVRHRGPRRAAVRAVRQERVGDARLHAGLPAPAQVGRAQRLLPEIWVSFQRHSSH